MSSKWEAFKTLVTSARSINDIDAAVLDAFLRAPRGAFDLYTPKVGGWRENVVAPVNVLNNLAATGRFPQLDRWFRRVPQKRNLVHRGGPLSAWIAHTFRNIQDVRRGTTTIVGKKKAGAREMTKAARNSAWLQTYMTRHALRGPALPLRAPTGPLYRVVYLTPAQYSRLISRGEWHDKGFMAFSRDKPAGGISCSHNIKVVFRLSLSDVTPGTPWIWFVGLQEKKRFPAITRWDDLGWSDLGLPGEHEVLLPPGTLRVNKLLDVKLTVNEDVCGNGNRGRPYKWVEVSFVPDPEFAWKPRRKGTRESNDNILWNIFARDKRERAPNRQGPNRQGPPSSRTRRS